MASATAACVAQSTAQQGAPGSAAADAVSSQAPDTVSIHLDPARTKVSFMAGSIRRIHGTFQLKTGLFALDTKSGMAQGEILVDASTEKSNDARLDQRIQNETLESTKYPGIFFHLEKVMGKLPAKGGEQHLKLTGTFNIHGADHPLTVDVDAVTTGSDVVLKSTFSVPYVQWGMKDASTLFMRDRDIKIMVEAHGTVAGLQPKT